MTCWILLSWIEGIFKGDIVIMEINYIGDLDNESQNRSLEWTDRYMEPLTTGYHNQ